MTKAPTVSRSRENAARKTHVSSSPLSSRAITNQRCRSPRPAPRTRAGPCWPLYGVYDVRCLNLSFCQVFETGRREHQRPVHRGARHTEMVCNSGCPVNSAELVRLGGIEPPTLGLEVLGPFGAFCLWIRTLNSSLTASVGCTRVRPIASRYVRSVTFWVTLPLRKGQSSHHEAPEFGIVDPDSLPRGIRIVVKPVGVFQHVAQLRHVRGIQNFLGRSEPLLA